VKLGDFGIARFASQISGSDLLMVRPHTWPEQIQVSLKIRARISFALGIVLYQMLTGLKPFDGSSLGAVCAQILNADPVPPSRHNPAVPQALDLIITRAWQKTPKIVLLPATSSLPSLSSSGSRPPSAAPKTRKPFWWSQPVGQRDVWITAAACLLLAASVQVSRPFRARFVVPLARQSIFSHRACPRGLRPPIAKCERSSAARHRS